MSLGTVVEVLGQQEGFELWRNTRVIFCWLDFMEVGFYFGIGTFWWWGLTSSLANIPALSQQDASVESSVLSDIPTSQTHSSKRAKPTQSGTYQVDKLGWC